MTDELTTVPKPRRKWGWFFVAAFVLQAIVFASIIGTDINDANSQRELGKNIYTQGARDCDANCRMGWLASTNSKSEQLYQEANMLMILAGIFSIATLTGSVLGLRRRK